MQKVVWNSHGSISSCGLQARIFCIHGKKMLLRGDGILTFAKSKIVVEIDNGFANYYRSFIPKNIKYNIPRYAPHITVSRNEEYNLPLIQNVVFDFAYDTELMIDQKYIWLNVISKNLADLRKSLNLPPMAELSRPPDGSDFFHITLGNFK